MLIDKPLSPQGYNIGVDPINTNPFFDGAPGGGGGEGVTDYNSLTGRPFINGKVLEGNKDLKLTTPAELQAAKTELASSVTQEEEARIAEDEAIRQEINTISLTPGPPGNDGAPGADGRAATVRVGSTETVEPGTPASVTNTGTENAAVLNFKIPRGAQGIQGIQGLPGADGKDGKPFTYDDFTPEQLEALRGQQGVPGVPGSDGAPGVAGRIESVSAETVPYTEEASVQNTGTEENAILHFKIPQGIPGTSGGEGGATVTVNVGTTTTGEPGTNAEVTNRGTEENVVLDFKIPRGNTGAPGADGNPGKDFTYEDFTPEQLEALRGPQGIQGVPGSDGAQGVDGKAATIQVGATETVEPGTPASVTNTGTENAAVLTFKIPRGNTGAPGADGNPGKDFTYEDFTPEQLEALRGPQGIQGVPGSDGAQGVDGKAATIQVGTVTTLPAGSDATVTNSGTENAAIFDFGIPQGIQGEPGSGGGGGGEIIASVVNVREIVQVPTIDAISNGVRVSAICGAELASTMNNKLILVALVSANIDGLYYEAAATWCGSTTGTTVIFNGVNNSFLHARVYRSGLGPYRINLELTAITGGSIEGRTASNFSILLKYLNVENSSARTLSLDEDKNYVILREAIE